MLGAPIRSIRPPLSASRCPPRPMPKVRGIHPRRGLSFQRKVTAALQHLSAARGFRLESEPWFAFDDAFGPGQAVPDIILFISDTPLIIEVKLTFVPSAPQKMRELYIPVIHSALGIRPRGLILCRNLTPTAEDVIPSLRFALPSETNGPIPTLQWLGHGGIPW